MPYIILKVYQCGPPRVSIHYSKSQSIIQFLKSSHHKQNIVLAESTYISTKQTLTMRELRLKFDQSDIVQKQWDMGHYQYTPCSNNEYIGNIDQFVELFYLVMMSNQWKVLLQTDVPKQMTSIQLYQCSTQANKIWSTYIIDTAKEFVGNDKKLIIKLVEELVKPLDHELSNVVSRIMKYKLLNNEDNENNDNNENIKKQQE